MNNSQLRTSLRSFVLSTLCVDLKGKEGLCEAASVTGNVEHVCIQANQMEHKLCQATQSQLGCHLREKRRILLGIEWVRKWQQLENHQTIMCEEAYHPRKVWQKISATSIRKCSCNSLVY